MAPDTPSPPPVPTTPPRRPAVRPLETFPARRGDATFLALRDPEGLIEDVLFAPPALAEVLALFDGTRTVEEARRDWEASTGIPMPAARLDRIVADLDARLVLEGERAAGARRAALEAYRGRPTRAAAHAGGAYPEDAAACDAFLAGHVEAAGPVEVPRGVRAVVAPHIDLRGGGACHGAAARALAASEAEVFVVLGTAHQWVRGAWALTDRDFETPFGVLPVDRGLVARLASRGGGGLGDDELAHRAEHSVEFQALWIRWLFRGRKDVRIVPVLVGSLGSCLRGDAEASPLGDPRLLDALAALREVADEGGSRAAFVASVDLAHVGPRYGDAEPVGPARREEVLAADRRLLATALAADPAGWFGFLRAERDARNVCGAAPVHALLHTIAGRSLRGTLLRHDDWEIDPATGSRVSFAAVAYAPA